MDPAEAGKYIYYYRIRKKTRRTLMLHAGIDIGGTSIKAGLIDSQNREIVIERSTAFPKSGYKNVCLTVGNMIKDMAAERGICPEGLGSIGIAVPGSIDPSGNRVIHAYNLDFHNAPIKEEITLGFPGTPVFLANDADAAALAELQGGVFTGAKTAVLITIGTGVGGGLILNGKMFRGGNGQGVELGHMMLIYGGEPCSCGNKGCVEAYCSATWLAEQGKRILRSGSSTLLRSMTEDLEDHVDAKLVIDAAKQGDPLAKGIFEIFIDHLSAAITSITSLLDPEIIAIGGGVGESGDFLYGPLNKAVKEKSFFKSNYNIVPASLGNRAGMVGAALLYRNEL